MSRKTNPRACIVSVCQGRDARGRRNIPLATGVRGVRACIAGRDVPVCPSRNEDPAPVAAEERAGDFDSSATTAGAGLSFAIASTRRQSRNVAQARRMPINRLWLPNVKTQST